MISDLVIERHDILLFKLFEGDAVLMLYCSSRIRRFSSLRTALASLFSFFEGRTPPDSSSNPVSGGAERSRLMPCDEATGAGSEE